MNDEIINRVIYGLLALSTILAVVLGASVFIQLHAEGPGSLSWNSWLDFFQLVGPDRPMMPGDVPTPFIFSGSFSATGGRAFPI